jgi:hypothetical protein
MTPDRLFRRRCERFGREFTKAMMPLWEIETAIAKKLVEVVERVRRGER